MKVIKDINKLLKYCIFMVIFFMLVGITYSYFVANITGVETDTTITLDAGKMEIEFDGGSQINATGLAPSDEPFGTKNFTVTGTSTIELSEMEYKSRLIIEENTLSENAISFALESTNTSDNGSVVPSIADEYYLGTENISLGNGKFIGPVSNAVHTYQMKFYYRETGIDQSSDRNKKFKAHILIENYYSPCSSGNCLKDKILGQNNVNVSTPLTIPGRQYSLPEEAVLSSASDDYGTSYYFRGSVENNYVLFADMCWRIVRITGNGAIKLTLYNYNKGENSCSGEGDTYAFARYDGEAYVTQFNASSIYNAYIGFMYGTPNAASYAEEHANINKSTILTNLETWYLNNLADYEEQLADTIWCNDKRIDTELPLHPGFGYGLNVTAYKGRGRLYASGEAVIKSAPTLICSYDSNGGKLSKFTVSDKRYGNGDLTYKIGLLTLDEIAFAGTMMEDEYICNEDFYLVENAIDVYEWWTMTPYYFNWDEAYMGAHSGGGCATQETVAEDYLGIRPAISLTATVQVTGEGTATNPYRVIN